MDRVLMWVERQTSEIPRDPSGCKELPAIDLDYREVSRQLWAFLGPLVSGNPVVNGVCENIDRHNGLEAWRQVAEPINDDKQLILQELLVPVTNPRGAANLEGFAGALELWDMNICLFKAAGGREPEGDAERIAFIKFLSPDVRAHVTLHEDMPQYQDFVELKRFALKYTKVMLGLNAERRMGSQPVRLVQDAQNCDEDEDEQGEIQDVVDAGEDSVEIPKFCHGRRGQGRDSRFHVGAGL